MPTLTTTPQPRNHGLTATAPDNILMTRIAGGDSVAFDELYRRHGHRALMLARKLCASRELAEEVTQEAFISLWRGAHAYRSSAGSVSAWLSSMVRNRAIDAWRRASVRPVEVETFEDGAGQLRASAFDEPAAPERTIALSLIADLPAPQKEAIFLAYFGDMTHSEIATAAETPLGTIKGRIRGGLQKLRCSYDERGDERPERPTSRSALRAVVPCSGADSVVELRPPARRRHAA